MSNAEDLLNNITEDNIELYTADSTTEEHIIIDDNRNITVPEELKRIAVQFDKNVETVTFDCPRYWDEHDLSTMHIFINYCRPDGITGVYLSKDIRVDETDNNIIHFEWLIGYEITMVAGEISFSISAKQVDDDDSIVRWYSEINEEMYVSQSLDGSNGFKDLDPDIYFDLLTKLNEISARIAIILNISPEELASNFAAINREFESVYTTIEEVRNLIPEWARQPNKPSYSYKELTDYNELTDIDRYNLVGKYNEPEIECATKYDDDLLSYGSWRTVETGKKFTKGDMTITFHSDRDYSKLSFWKDNGEETSIPQFGLVNIGCCTISELDDLPYAQLGHWDTGYILIDMGESIRPFLQILLDSNASEPICELGCQGSNDNNNWVDIQSSTPFDNDEVMFKINPGLDTYYRYYKLNWEYSRSSAIRIYGIGTEKYYRQNTLDYDVLKLDNVINEYEKQMRVLIETPSDYTQQGDNVYLDINNLGRKMLDTPPVASKRYELVYNGESFGVKEVI